MTKYPGKPSRDGSYEQLVAEEELILHAQMLIQKVLNDGGISQKHLADKLGVGESYVSQMLGTSARNLTLRTIARVMKALDAKATLVLDVPHGAATVTETHNAPTAAARTASAAEAVSPWGAVVALSPRRKSQRRADGEALAYSSFDLPMQEMAMAA